MTRAEREMMIGRYMGGGMSTAEEQEFFIQVAVDPELRLELKAHRTVESAIRKDRDAEPAGHTALRGRIASTLAAYPPTPSGIGEKAPTVTPPASAIVQTGGMALGKWLGAAFVVVATAVGGTLLFPLFDDASDSVPSARGSVQVVTGESDSTRPLPAPDNAAIPAPSGTPRSATSSETSVSRHESAPIRNSGARPVDRLSDRQSDRESARPGIDEQQSRAADVRSSRRRSSLPDIDGAAAKRSSGDSVQIGITVVVPKK